MNSLSLISVLRKIQSLSAECEAISNIMSENLRKIEFLALALSFKAEDLNLKPSIIENLKQDAIYAVKLREENLQLLTDDVLEFFVDFLSYINNNDDIKNIITKKKKEL